MRNRRSALAALAVVALTIPTSVSAYMVWHGNYSSTIRNWFRAATPIIGSDWIAVGSTDETSSGLNEHLRMARIDETGALVADWRITGTTPQQNRTDTFRGVAPSPDGGWVTVGDITLPGGLGDTDAWVAKWRPSGLLQWSLLIGTTLREYAFQVATCTSGGYFVSGVVIGQELTSAVIKLSESGTIEWQKFIAGVGSPLDTSNLVGTADGGCVFLGIGGLPYFLVIKLAADGTVDWKREFGGSNPYPNSYIRSVATTPDGGYILIGDHSSELWLVKLNSAGHVVWQKVMLAREGGVGQLTRGWDAVALGDGYVLAGFGHIHNWFVRTDLEGNILWQWSYRIPYSSAIATDLVLGPGETFVGVGKTENYESWLLRARLSTGLVDPTCDMVETTATVSTPGEPVQFDSDAIVTDATLDVLVDPAVVIENIEPHPTIYCSAINSEEFIFGGDFEDGGFGDWTLVNP